MPGDSQRGNGHTHVGQRVRMPHVRATHRNYGGCRDRDQDEQCGEDRVELPIGPVVR